MFIEFDSLNPETAPLGAKGGRDGKHILTNLHSDSIRRGGQAITHYIQNQEKHHQRSSFRSEYLTLLRKFDIAFEEKYVFHFI